MLYCARAAGAVTALVAGLAAHTGHGSMLHQTMPGPVMKLGSRYEHLIMRAINFLAMQEWLYANATTRRAVEWLSDKIMAITNGEVLALDEALEMVTRLGEEGHALATGTCPCRRARNDISDVVPNNTDMVFGRWAEEYLRNYPGLYHRIDAAEARELIEQFDACGFIHQIYGFNRKEGAAYVMCNCDKSVCIPLLAQKTRGFQSFRKGRSEAVVDPAACKGLAECGVCIKRCPFDAREADAGENGAKAVVRPGACYGCGVCVATCSGAATSMVRRPGAELIYARPFVS